MGGCPNLFPHSLHTLSRVVCFLHQIVVRQCDTSEYLKYYQLLFCHLNRRYDFFATFSILLVELFVLKQQLESFVEFSEYLQSFQLSARQKCRVRKKFHAMDG